MSELRVAAERAVQLAQTAGAGQAAASAFEARDVSVTWRDGKLETIAEATTSGVGIELYVDGRYASVSTSDLRPDALAAFVTEAVAMTRAIAEDRFRALPDPALYVGQSAVELDLEDAAYDAVTAVQRREVAQQLEAAARDVPGAERILSVTTSCSDSRSESYRVHSNGFSGGKRGTAFWLGAEVSVQDADGRRPEDSAFAGARHRSALPDAARVGREATERTLARLGASKGRSAVLPMVLDHRVGGRLLSHLLAPLHGGPLQQQRSFLQGRFGEQIGSNLLHLSDDPLLPGGFGSRLFDGEGLAARRFALFEHGALRGAYLDTYYARKLGELPTTARMSNLAWRLGDRDRAALIASVPEGILVTGLLGGNSNATTGDFSLGVQGFAIEDGRIGAPLAEMNIAGNHLTFWKNLAAVGNDPYAYSAMRTPTLLFDAVQFAGT